MRAGTPTATLRADFRAPSRLGETLDFALAPVRIGRSSLDIRVTVTCGGERRVEFASTLVWIDMDDGRARPWPEALRLRILQEIESEGTGA